MNNFAQHTPPLQPAADQLSGAAGNLGLVADYKRDIVITAPIFDRLYPKADNKRTIKRDNTTARLTIDDMTELVPVWAWQTKKVAAQLRQSTLEETLREVWNHVYNHFQYELDKPGEEEVRTPARSWADRFTGIDCDCMSFLIATILHNLGIGFKFRVTRYDGGWQHVYITVPAKSHPKGYYTLDCVLNEFDAEKPFSGKFDTKYNFSMNGLGIPLSILSGASSAEDIYSSSVDLLDSIVQGTHFSGVMLGSLGTANDALFAYLNDTRRFIAANPQAVVNQGGAKPMIDMLDYAIAAWNTPNRDLALQHLEREEERWNNFAGLSGCADDCDVDGLLGRVKGERKFFSAVKNAAEKIKDAAKDVGGKVRDAAQKAVKAVVRFNPLTLAMRGGLLLALKVNLLKMSERMFLDGLGNGGGNYGGRANSDINPNWKNNTSGENTTPGSNSGNVVSSRPNSQGPRFNEQKFERLARFFEKIGGKRDKLREAIYDGYRRRHEFTPDAVNGLGGLGAIGALGEPIMAASLISAAPAILEAYNVIVNNREPGEVDTSAFAGLGAFRLFKKNTPTAAAVAVATKPETANKISVDEPGTQKTSAVANEEAEAAAAAVKGDQKKFVTLIKDWLAKRKSKTAKFAAAATDQKKQDATESTEDSRLNTSKPDEVAPKNNDANNTDDKPGFWIRTTNWVKANPWGAGLIALGAAGLITIAASPKARAYVFGGDKKNDAGNNNNNSNVNNLNNQANYNNVNSLNNQANYNNVNSVNNNHFNANVSTNPTINVSTNNRTINGLKKKSRKASKKKMQTIKV